MNQAARTSTYWIEKLNLEPHPEGGFYKETYRSSHVNTNAFGTDCTRNSCTGIYFLLRPQDSSFFHKIKSDEMWHFYDGGALRIYEINGEGVLKTIDLGLDLEKGQVPQYVVPAGVWFGSKPLNSFSLVGCTVSPGFDFNDFELANKNTFHELFPNQTETINSLK